MLLTRHESQGKALFNCEGLKDDNPLLFAGDIKATVGGGEGLRTDPNEGEPSSGGLEGG